MLEVYLVGQAVDYLKTFGSRLLVDVKNAEGIVHSAIFDKNLIRESIGVNLVADFAWQARKVIHYYSREGCSPVWDCYATEERDQAVIADHVVGGRRSVDEDRSVSRC
jgi:hypothetical protein